MLLVLQRSLRHNDKNEFNAKTGIESYSNILMRYNQERVLVPQIDARTSRLL